MALNKQQLSELEKHLNEMEQNSARELRKDIQQSEATESFTQVAGEAPDPGDRSVADLTSDLEAADIARHGGALEDVAAARTRIADGSYGVCIDCDGDIGFERLRANPVALRCIRCQERYEKTHEGGGRPTL